MPRRCNVADALWAARHEAQRNFLKKAAKAAFLKTKKDAFGRLFALCSWNLLEKAAEKWYIVLVKMCHYTLIVGDDAFFKEEFARVLKGIGDPRVQELPGQDGAQLR